MYAYIAIALTKKIHLSFHLAHPAYPTRFAKKIQYPPQNTCWRVGWRRNRVPYGVNFVLLNKIVCFVLAKLLLPPPPPRQAGTAALPPPPPPPSYRQCHHAAATPPSSYCHCRQAVATATATSAIATRCRHPPLPPQPPRCRRHTATTTALLMPPRCRCHRAAAAKSVVC